MSLNLNYDSTIESRDLAIYIENTGAIYRGMTTSTIKNLAKKYDNGLFDTELALKAFYNIAMTGAKMYVKEFCSRDCKWYEVFSVEDRKLAAMELLEYYYENINGFNPIS